MKTFSQFINEQDGMPVEDNPTNAATSQMPPEKQPSPETNREMENATNEVQRAIDNLLSVVNKHNVNKNKVMGILQTMISNISNQTGTSNVDTRQNAIKTNQEPYKVPGQPQAV